MTELITATQTSVALVNNKKRWIPYLLLIMIINSAMWGVAILYLINAKSNFTSKFSLSLPGTVSYTNITLPERGTASSQPVSPYENTIQDPRENYKIIIESSVVQKAAAARVNMTVEEFGKPRFKIIDKTTAMNFEFTGKSPEQAQAKSWAFYEALQERLNRLRRTESAQKEDKIQNSLKTSQRKLQIAQKAFFDYRNLSGLVTDTQLEDLAKNLEQLRRERDEAIVKQQQSSTRLRELSSNFKISTPEASKSFILQSDQIFRQHLKNYAEATSNLVSLQSKFLPSHPLVIDAQGKQNLASTALLNRSQSLLGYAIDQQTLSKLSGDSGAQQSFVEGIVTADVNRQESKATVQELDSQISQLETRFQTMAKHKSTLEALKREMQIAEAVYSSSLASLDVSKSNFYGSYPEVQLLTEPSLPEEANSPNKKLVLLGTGLASILSITAVLTMYFRSSRSNVLKFTTSRIAREER
jgi:uncharacterized protein involved in exopolysaccharide biosynthesis